MNFVAVEFGLLLSLIYTLGRVLPAKALPWILVAGSVIFYGGWNWNLVWLLLTVKGLAYIGGFVVQRYRSPLALGVMLGAIFSFLIYFKYAGFLVRSANQALSLFGASTGFSFANLALPIGISFFTFQAAAYLIDVYRREIEAERSLLHFMLFMLFFPLLVAGPIERYSHLMPQLKVIGERLRSAGDPLGGLFLILQGVAIKLVIADNLSVFVDEVYLSPATASPGDILLATYFFSIQIYCDFFGYTLIALGIAAMFGVELINNFNHPYLACNIQEFWRRWHITLSRWFRDYLYIPLGGSRVGNGRLAFNLILTLGLVGFWHGASFTFLAWGFTHGLMLVIHRFFRVVVPKTGGVSSPAWRLPAWLLTFHGVTVAWVLFRAPDFGAAWTVFSKLLETPALLVAGKLVLNPLVGFYLWIILGFAVWEGANRLLDLRGLYRRAPLLIQSAVAALLLLVTLLGPERDVQFIYFQF